MERTPSSEQRNNLNEKYPSRTVVSIEGDATDLRDDLVTDSFSQEQDNIEKDRAKTNQTKIGYVRDKLYTEEEQVEQNKEERLRQYISTIDKLWSITMSSESFGADYYGHYEQGVKYLTDNCSDIFDLLWVHISREGELVTNESKPYLWKLQQLRNMANRDIFNSCLSEHLTNETAFENLLKNVSMPGTTKEVIEASLSGRERAIRAISSIIRAIRGLFYK